MTETKTILYPQQYSASDLPTIFRWQIRDFSRLVWDAPAMHGRELHPARWQPNYFVLADGETLISSAAVLQTTVTIRDKTYRVFGLGMVMTYPEFRNQGHGSSVVAAATSHIKRALNADIALLQTNPNLEKFFWAFGWKHNPAIRVLSGDPERPTDTDAWAMTMMLSDRAKRTPSDFERPLYLDALVW